MDILVSFDTTGSMSPAISQVRREIKELLTRLFSTIPDLRVGLIAHGDYCDDGNPYVTKAVDFTTNVNNLINFIEKVKNTGGGDSDECYEYVLEEANIYSWQSNKRALIMIGDAAPHRTGYRYGSFTAVDWKQQANKLRDNGVSIYAVECLGGYGSRGFWQDLANVGNTPKLNLAQFHDLPQLLTAIAFKQHDDDTLREYGNTLQVEGRLNRNVADLIDSLLREKTFSTARHLERADGLVPVDPHRFQKLDVDNKVSIKDFVLSTGARFNIGRGFYELTKREEIQEGKEVVLVDNKTGDMFSGAEARKLINLPYGERDNRAPKDVPKGYTAFVQSTSSNRVLMPGTKFLYEVSY